MNYPAWLDFYSFLIYDSLDSTNAEGRRLYKAGVRKDTIIWSKTQTIGRGRDNKKWDSPKGNLYITILLTKKLSIKTATNFSFLVAVALAEAIDYLTDSALNLHFKWPNDLLLEGKKVAGILLESINIVQSEFIDSLMIGVGCNLVKHPENTPYGATNLKEQGYLIKPEDFLNKFIEFFHFNKNLLELDGFSVIREKWLTKAYGIGQVVTIKTNNNRIVGIFKGINEEGLMVVELTNGQNCFINSGELFFGREINEYVG
jgi:BirA family biotin operon repressor/biotin-[acetyl-CoA-carboxylase] ligase